MATAAQKTAARQNIKQAQAAWRGMTKRQHSLAQPEGRGRQKPGATGRGQYYRIMVRPKEEFITFRIQDVGRKGHTERLAGKRASGSWDTEAWLVNKKDAHVEKNKLVIDNPQTKTILKQVRGPIMHKRGDIFEAKPRRNVPERLKPTPAQLRARRANIKKAQAARRKRR